MAITWPSTLPSAPLLNAVRACDSSNIISTPMDAGPAKMRPRYAPVESGTLQCSFVLTDREAYDFKTFYEVTTERVNSFTFEDQIADVSLECRFVAKQPPSFTILVGGLPASLTGTDPADAAQRLHTCQVLFEIVGPGV